MIPSMSFAGKNLLLDFDTFTDFSKAFGNPEHDYEFMDVLGLDGSLTIDNKRFKDRDIEIPAFVMNDFIDKYRALMAFMNSRRGFQRVECSHEPDHYRMALFLGTVDPEPTQFLKDGRFVLPFRFHPQRWLKTGETATEVQTGDTMINPTLFESYPLIRMYGTGTLTINSQTITVSAHSYNYIDLDCRTMNAQYESNRANSYITTPDDYITMKPGTNGITTTLTKVEITPRWWEV